MIKKNDIYTCEITGTTHDGSGVGRVDGFALFVPGAIVGERVRIQVLKVLAHYGYAKIVEIIEPSPARIESDCPVSSRCGGCTYRHMTYKQELAIKTEHVRDCLYKNAGIEMPLPDCLPSPLQQGYRNKCQYPVSWKDGRLVFGYYGKNSHRLVPCTSCRLHPPVFDEIAAFLCDHLGRLGVDAYDEIQHRGLLRHICLRRAETSGQIMVTLVVCGDALPQEQQLCRDLCAAFPQVCSIYCSSQKARTNVVMGRHCRLLWGQKQIYDRLCGVELGISPLSFYQVNRQSAQNLYQLAADFAQLQKEDILLDLYCGTGAIGLGMAARVQALYGVEVIADAVQDARDNARRNGIENAQFLCGDCKSAVDYFAAHHIEPTVVILDPPRKGCDSHVIDEVCALAPQRVVMISCNAATMARDAALFCRGGYRLEKVQPVDLFPRTAHVETVVLLSHKKPDCHINVKVEFGEGEGKVTLKEI